MRGGQILEETRPGFIELAVGAHAHAKELIDEAVETHQPPLACSKGCDYCCHFPVNVSVPEVVAIIDYVERHFSPSQQQALGERIREKRRALLQLTADQRRHTNIRCPLLKEDGCCSVYRVRPLGCRGFNSTDVEACRRRFEQPDKDISNPAFGYNVFAARGVAQGVRLALKDAGLEPLQLDLIKALHLFWDDPSGVVKKWRKKGTRAIKSAVAFDSK